MSTCFLLRKHRVTYIFNDNLTYWGIFTTHWVDQVPRRRAQLTCKGPGEAPSTCSGSAWPWPISLPVGASGGGPLTFVKCTQPEIVLTEQFHLPRSSTPSQRVGPLWDLPLSQR